MLNRYRVVVGFRGANFNTMFYGDTSRGKQIHECSRMIRAASKADAAERAMTWACDLKSKDGPRLLRGQCWVGAVYEA